MDNRLELRLLTGPQALEAVIEPKRLRCRPRAKRRRQIFLQINDPDKEAALKKAKEEASASEYMIAPRTELKLLKEVKNGKYYDDCLILDSSFSPGLQAWVNAGDLLQRTQYPRVGFGNRQYECGAAAVIHPSEVFLAWHSAFLFRREKIPGASF